MADVVKELAAGKGFLFANRGETALRGFEDPVCPYEVRWEGWLYRLGFVQQSWSYAFAGQRLFLAAEPA